MKKRARTPQAGADTQPDGVAEHLAELGAKVRYRLDVIQPDLARRAADRRLAALNLAPSALRNLMDKARIYGRAMKARKWPINGDAIIYDEEGDLIDGLARLVACAESGTPFPTVVIEGVPKRAARTIGSHLRRTQGDILDINGEENPRSVAFAWSVLLSYLNAPDRTAYSKSRSAQVSASEMLQLTDRYPQIRDSAKLVDSTGAGSLIGDGLGVACHFIMSLAHEGLAGSFMRILGDPALDPRSAPATLGQRLQNLHRTPQTYRFALAAKAWNRYRTGSRIGASGLVFNGRVEGRTLGMEAFPAFAGVPEGFRLDLTGIKGEGRDRTPRYDAIDQVDQENPPTIGIAYVTWQECQGFLAVNGPLGTGRNRAMRRSHWARIARDLTQGRWVLNGQSLKFSRSGRLIDGQHRCKAAVESRTGFVTFVVRGLDDNLFCTYDGGESKHLSKHLREQGAVNASALAAALGMLSRVLNNEHRILTAGEGFELLAEHPGLQGSLTGHGSHLIKDLLQPSVASALHYLFGRKDEAQRDVFFKDLATGSMLRDDDPVMRLRNVLMLPSMRSKYPLAEQRAKIAIQAWNARRSGKSLRGFVTDEGFPVIL